MAGDVAQTLSVGSVLLAHTSGGPLEKRTTEWSEFFKTTSDFPDSF